MKRLFPVALAMAAFVACSAANGRLDPPGSYGAGGAPTGSLFANQKGNVSCQGPEAACVGQSVGAKQGESCASLVLGGFLAFGDMSVSSAAKNGNITKIGSVDYSTFNVLGALYWQKCTIVNGD